MSAFEPAIETLQVLATETKALLLALLNKSSNLSSVNSLLSSVLTESDVFFVAFFEFSVK